MKNYKSLFAILFLFSHVCYASQSAEYKSGKDFVSGALDEVTARMTDSKNGDQIAKVTQNVAEGVVKGLAGSLKENGGLDKLTGEAGQALQRNVGSLVTDLGKSAVIAAKKSGDGMKEASYIGSKNAAESIDIARDNIAPAVGRIVEDINKKAINKLLHENALKGGVIFLGVCTGYFTLKYGVPLAFKMIERELVRPKLIIESSKKTLKEKIFGCSSQEPAPMVFSPALKQQLDSIVKVTSTINKKVKQGKTNVKYRNLMLFGPPGTGKTMFAKELAKQSGLEYAFMSGSSFSKFKDGEGIEALDELFAWAKKSNGLMIFIDEAEAFLSKRDGMDPQSRAYQLLNNFLNYTGERSNKFMIVFATNHQDVLDSAMYRRIDDLIEMPLPSKLQRIDTLNLYKNKILMDVAQNGKAFVDSVRNCLHAQAIEHIAERTIGLSYGDLEGIINTIKTDTDILEPALVTTGLINKVVDRAIKKNQTFTHGKPLGAIED